MSTADDSLQNQQNSESALRRVTRPVGFVQLINASEP
jgi:hypothetical protein